jgi:hypothetical protein
LISSVLRSGQALKISTVIMPAAIIPRMVETGIRSPRIQATPPICLGLTVILSNPMAFVKIGLSLFGSVSGELVLKQPLGMPIGGNNLPVYGVS